VLGRRKRRKGHGAENAGSDSEYRSYPAIAFNFPL
jgi:hypothetical protein